MPDYTSPTAAATGMSADDLTGILRGRPELLRSSTFEVAVTPSDLCTDPPCRLRPSVADRPDLNRRRVSPLSAASHGTWVFVVLLPDPDDRSGLSRLLADVTLPEATPRVTYLAAPTNAEQFFSEQSGAAGWAAENVAAEGTVVYLLNHEPRMPEIIVKHEGLFYIGVEDVAAAEYYRGMDRVSWHAAIPSPPRPS